jgi:uncharacterized membrane protein YkoI
MKKTILLLALPIIMVNAYSQEKKENSENEKQVTVSEIIKKAFTKEFPKVEKVKWSEEKAGEFEAEFVMNKIEMSANFDSKGNLIETESEIKESDLPQAIKSVLTKNFAGYKLNEFEKSEAKGIIKYEIEAKKDGIEYELVFDHTGKIISQKEEKD